MTIENNSEFPAHVCLAILIFNTDKCAWKTYKLLHQKIIQMFNSAIPSVVRMDNLQASVLKDNTK